MKIFLTVFFLLVFGLLILLATVDLEPYFNPRGEPRPPLSGPVTGVDSPLSTTEAEETREEKTLPSKITTHQLIVTDSSIETGRSEPGEGSGKTERPEPAPPAPKENVTAPKPEASP